MLEYVYLILAAVLSFIISANNSANSVGTLYGSRMTRYTTAALYSGFFIALGTVLEGWKMGNAIGGGIVESPLTLSMALMVLLTTAILMLLFTLLSIPLSSSQIMVGSIVGVGIATGLFINLSFVSLVGISWILTFLFSMGLAYFFYALLSHFAPHMGFLFISRFYTLSLLLGCAFISYTLGANTLGLVASMNPSPLSLALVAISSILGVYFLGKRTVRTAGKRIIRLDPPRAFSAQIAGAIVVEIFTQMHFPVSVTQAIIGGIIGTGLIKGYREMNKKLLMELGISWIAAPIISLLLTLLILKVSSLP